MTYRELCKQPALGVSAPPPVHNDNDRKLSSEQLMGPVRPRLIPKHLSDFGHVSGHLGPVTRRQFLTVLAKSRNGRCGGVKLLQKGQCVRRSINRFPLLKLNFDSETRISGYR